MGLGGTRWVWVGLGGSGCVCVCGCVGGCVGCGCV